LRLVTLVFRTIGMSLLLRFFRFFYVFSKHFLPCFVRFLELWAAVYRGSSDSQVSYVQNFTIAGIFGE